MRERLVQQEPDRADFQIDLVKSLAGMGDRDSLRRALDILIALRDSNHLSPADAPLLDWVQRLLNESSGAASA